MPETDSPLRPPSPPGAARCSPGGSSTRRSRASSRSTGPSPRFRRPPLAGEPAGGFMRYSSGTTGRPKGIKRPLPEAGIDDPPEASPLEPLVRRVWGFDEPTPYTSLRPRFHHFAPAGFSTTARRPGGTVVMMERFDPEFALECSERYRVTYSQRVPTMFSRMLELPEAAPTSPITSAPARSTSRTSGRGYRPESSINACARRATGAITAHGSSEEEERRWPGISRTTRNFNPP